ncbi:uncharacterized protein [Bemisia tabaci]|uniref:uncharacterized protein isoform X1 n=1 Tax=Bemisia tabaci TaxID=7038 RepID=UPI003B282ED4
MENQKRKKREVEGIYNQSYLYEKGFIVLDTILPLGIESCDLIKYDDNSVYLYHVKKTLGQSTREACSQILNAAEMIRGAITLSQGSESSNYLERLWREITEYNGDEEWKKVVAEQSHRVTVMLWQTLTKC